MPKEYQPEALIHFTTRPAVLGILDKGFALIPCDKRLLDDLFGKNRPFVGDPQNFGMICFTDAPLSETREVRKKGNHGVGMSLEWALANGARKVTYISYWKAFVLRQKFNKALKQMESCIA